MQTMEKPSEQIIKLPEGTTDRLIDICPLIDDRIETKQAFHMMKKYLVNDKVFGHPGKFNKQTGRFEKIDLDYQLTDNKEVKMIITKSDRPSVPTNKVPQKSARFYVPDNKLTSVNGHKSRGYTSTYELSDEFCDSMEAKAGFDRIILSGEMIDYVINNHIDGHFNKCKKGAVINWFAFGFNIESRRNAQSEIYKVFTEQYLESMDYLQDADYFARQQFLYYSINILIKSIMWFQR